MKHLKFVSALFAAVITFSSIPQTAFTLAAASAASTSAELELVSGKLDGDGSENKAEVITGVDISTLPYVRVTYKSNVTAAHELLLTVNGKEAVICDDISKSGGKTVKSAAVFVPKALRDAIAKGDRASIRCTASADGCETEISEIRFFVSDKAAYDHYGEKRTDPYVPNMITFGEGGNAAFHSTDPKYGKHVYEASTDSLAITHYDSIGYATMAKLADPSKWRDGDCYVRVLYEAVTESKNVEMYLRNNATNERVTIGHTNKTNGFVLSNAVKLPDGHVDRYARGIHCTLHFADEALNSTYRVKAIIFFPTYETATAYTVPKVSEPETDITIMGTHILKYRIVIPSGADDTVRSAAQTVSDTIFEKSGMRIGTVLDGTAPCEYEIIVGDCNRAESGTAPIGYGRSYEVFGSGKKIVLRGFTGADLQKAAEDFSRICLERGKHSDGSIDIGSDVYLMRASAVEFPSLSFEAADKPLQVNYSFDSASDADKFSVSGGNAIYRSGALRIVGDGLTVAESPLYDSDVSLEWAFSYGDTVDGARFGAMLRQNNDGSYVSVSYDADAGKLRAIVKPAMVYEEYVIAECELSLLAGHLYRMKAELVGEELTVSLWGNEILKTDGVFMNAPGKAAFFTDGAALEICELDTSLLTADGRILGDVIYNETVIMKAGGDSNYRIPSMICTNDGTLIAAANDRRYTVADGAQEQWLVYRRKPVDGDWEEIKVLASKEKTAYAIGNAIYDDVNDVIIILYSRFGAFSYDDGLTWEIKEITKLANSYGGKAQTHGASAGFVLKHGEHAGRIISPARYSLVGGESLENLQTNHYNCAIYSDDGGLTWQTSEPVQNGTGEGTLIEREDGVIVYNSRAYFRDHYRRVAYSYDGGETFTDFRIDGELLEPHHGVNAAMLQAKMKNGQIVTLFSNPYPTAEMMGRTTRKNMTVSLSYNEAGSWATRKTVYSGFSAYSSLAYNPVTDTFFLMYEGDDDDNGYGFIAVVEFNLEWILD